MKSLPSMYQKTVAKATLNKRVIFPVVEVKGQ